MRPDQLDDWLAAGPSRRPLVMGVLNVTPDSFSDGGRVGDDPRRAADVAAEMVAAGADWIDIGGESTRPGSDPVAEDEQARRVVPAVAAIRAAGSDVLLSIDTTRASVAERALDAGANVVNDVSAGRDDPAMLTRVAARGAAVILMHMQGTPKTMQLAPSYTDVVGEVAAFLAARRDAAAAAGVDPRRVLFDPGLGFGKTTAHNLLLLRATRRLADLGAPLVVGPSRKRFVGDVIGEADALRRVHGTAAAAAWAVAHGAAVVRAHDVGPIAQTVRMIRAIGAGALAGDDESADIDR